MRVGVHVQTVGIIMRLKIALNILSSPGMRYVHTPMVLTVVADPIPLSSLIIMTRYTYIH